MRHLLIPSLSQVHADNGGLGIFAPGWTHQGRLLTSSVVLLGLRGSVPLVVDGDELTVVPGRIAVLPAGLGHRGSRPIGEGASYYWLHFTLPEPTMVLSQEEADTILSSEGVTSHRLDEAAFLPFEFDLPEPEPHLEAFRELLNLQEKPTYTRWKFQLLFQKLLIQLTETVIEAHRPPSVASSSSSVVYGILACVAEHLTDPNLSVKTVSQALGLNLDYAGRRFKQVMGLSVGDYILQQRLKLALVQLKETGDTLEAVAADCGFGSLRHFLRQFKTSFGHTPSEARSRHRMMHFNSL